MSEQPREEGRGFTREELRRDTYLPGKDGALQPATARGEGDDLAKLRQELLLRAADLNADYVRSGAESAARDCRLMQRTAFLLHASTHPEQSARVDLAEVQEAAAKAICDIRAEYPRWPSTPTEQGEAGVDPVFSIRGAKIRWNSDGDEHFGGSIEDNFAIGDVLYVRGFKNQDRMLDTIIVERDESLPPGTIVVEANQPAPEGEGEAS